MYEDGDGASIVWMGALIQVTEARKASGLRGEIASGSAIGGSHMAPVALLTFICVATLLITPIINNAATVLLMGPIAAGFALKLGLNVDPFLMAVAIAASCEFLTPFGHQSNVLVLGPGGYRFGDYARLGVPLSIIVTIVAVPLIALVWPLGG
mgnify:CR=1 FL=1